LIGERKTYKLISPKDLKHLNGLVADILHKVAHVLGHDANIPRDVVKGTRIALGTKYSDACSALDEQGPFIAVTPPTISHQLADF